MVELDLKKLTAPDFTVSIREGIPSLMVINEDAVPSIYWQPSEPRLNRQELAYELKQGAEIAGVSDFIFIITIRLVNFCRFSCWPDSLPIWSRHRHWDVRQGHLGLVRDSCEALCKK
jgi:Siphovirus Gp157